MAGVIPSGPSVLTPDSSEALLSQARSQAQQSLREAMPNQALSFEPAARSSSVNVGVIPTGQPPPDDPNAVPLRPPPTAEDMVGTEPPPTAQQPVEPAKDPHFWATFRNHVSSAATAGVMGVPRMFAGVLTKLAPYLDESTDFGARPTAESQAANDQTADALFKAIDDTFAPGLKHLSQNRAMLEKDGHLSKAGQITGGLTGGLLTLGMGPEAFLAGATMEGGTSAVDQGAGLRGAYVLAGTALAANTLGMAVPFKSPSLLRRIVANGAWGATTTPAVQFLAKATLNEIGEKKVAKDINPLDPTNLGAATLMSALFGALAKPSVQKKFNDLNAKNPPPPPPGATGKPPDIAVNPPPNSPAGAAAAVDAAQAAIDQSIAARTAARAAPEPVAPAAAQGIPAGKPAPAPVAAAAPDALGTPPPGFEPRTVTVGGRTQTIGEPVAPPPTAVAPVAKVPDAPSAEPKGDLVAQWKDLNDPATKRKAVYLSAENRAANKDFADSLTAGPDKKGNPKGLPHIEGFKEPGDVIIFDTPKSRLHALKLRGEGVPMDTIIGRATGAGEGKRADQTAVVQGRTPEGAVATEGAVTPAEVPAKVAEVKAEGKIPVVTTPEAAVARRAALVEGDRVILKAPGGERAVVVDGPAKDGRVPVRMVDEEGNVGKAVIQADEKLIQGAADAGGEKTPSSVTPTEHGPAKKVEPATDLSHEAVGEKPAKSAATAEASEPVVEKPVTKVEPAAQSSELAETGSDSKNKSELDQAAAFLRASEKPAPGKKLPAKLQDRAANISAFARVLKAAAAKAAKNKTADEAAITRATEAAKAAERFDAKSTEDVDKGRGISHEELQQHAREMLNAAEQLQGRTAEAKTEVAPKAAKLARNLQKQRDAMAREKAERENPKKPEPAKTKSGIADVVDEVKVAKENAGRLRDLNRSERLKLDQAIQRYSMAGGEDGAKYARDQVEALFRELHGDVHPDMLNAVMQSVDNARAEARGEAPRDEIGEIDREMGVRGIDYQDSTLTKEDFASLAGSNAHVDELHQAMEKSGALRELDRMRLTGGAASAHKLLDHMASLLAPGPLRDLVVKLRATVPDVHIEPTHMIRLAGGREAPHYDGLYEPGRNAIQLATNGRNSTQILLHELVHAGTVDFLKHNPTHPLSLEVERLRGIAEARLRAQHGDEVVSKNLTYMRSPAAAERPAFMNRAMYGLTNAREFLAEIQTNPAFQRMIAESESHALPNEHLPGGIIKNLVRTLARMLGVRRPDGVRLLDSIFQISDKVMEAQRTGEVPSSLEDAYASLREEPPTMRNESRLREIVGDKGTEAAKRFYHSIRTGALGAIRKGTLGLSTERQIFRSWKHVFGTDDAANPLRQMEDAVTSGADVTHEFVERAQPVLTKWARLNGEQNKRVGQLMADATTYGIDPTVPKDGHSKATRFRPKFNERYDEYQKRWNNLTAEEKEVFTGVRDVNEWGARRLRNVGIDTALRAFSPAEIPPAKRQLLYSVRKANHYDNLIGDGKLIDVGDRNAELLRGVKTLAGLNELDGPYFHLGRNGDKVVQIKPEGTRNFASKDAAEHFAEQIRDLSPESEAVVAENRAGTFDVEFKADYVSMHEKASDAEAEAQRLRDRGFDVGNVTEKINDRATAPLSQGLQQIVSETTRRVNRNGADAGTAAILDALRTSFLQMMAARSAYAGSKLARRGTGGVKPEEMMRNFADHFQASAWNAGQLASVFKKGEALGKVREAAKQQTGLTQQQSYQRGAVMSEINKRLQQETRQYGVKSAFSSTIAKIGFLNYLASPAHTILNLSQNFQVGLPVAVSKWGARATPSFLNAMRVVAGPAFRETFLAHIKPGELSSHDVQTGVLAAMAKDPRYGKWVTGKNSPMKQLMDRGVITTSFSNELGELARGDNRTVSRVMDYARLMPHMADLFNRISTALAGLELSKGDVYKTAHFVDEVHMDYSQGNKPRAFKALSGHIPLLNTVTMFRTYTQGLTHLLYSNFRNILTAESKSRAEAAKAFGGLVLTSTLLTGVTGGVMLEPIRLAMYAYRKMFGDEDEFSDVNNSIAHFMSDALGSKMGEAAAFGAPRLLGADVSSRMGLSDLILHDPPDLLTSDVASKMPEFISSIMGPMAQMVGQRGGQIMKHFEDGEPVKALLSAVPVKAVADLATAAEYATSGKRNSQGAGLTDASTYDAVIRAAGFKPAAVADADERGRVSYDYYQFTRGRRQAILRQAAKNGLPSVLEKVAAYNAANPGQAITVSDFMRQQRGVQRAEGVAEGLPGRDPKLNQMLDY